MTYEEMRDVVDAILDAGEAAAAKAEKVLQLLPKDDVILGELHDLFMAAGDDFKTIRDNNGDYDAIIAAATRVRDTSMAWSSYVEATAKALEKSTLGRMEAILARLHRRGLIVDSGERRWSPKKRCDDTVWVIAPGVPADYDAGSVDANTVLDYLRAHS